MAQVLKSTKYFELFGSLNPGTVRVSTENSKDEVILGRYAIYSPATALFRFKGRELGTTTMATNAPDRADHATRRSFIEVPPQSDFPIQNLPYGVFKPHGHTSPRVGVAIGSFVLDLSVLADERLLGDEATSMGYFADDSLNRFMSRGRGVWSATRARIIELLSHDCPTIRDNQALRAAALCSMATVSLQMPLRVTAYSDFYSSLDHARNVGTLLRGADNALNPNWKHVPIAYNGRHSSIVISGEMLSRPRGQCKPSDDAPPVFEPTKALDFELELGFVVGVPSRLGVAITPEQTDEHVFGVVLFNDWSARDFQKWEYQPLGPFNGKNFFSSISPWIVTLAALEPFQVPACPQDPQPLPYLRSRRMVYDIHLDVSIHSAAMQPGEAHRVTHSNAKYLYWDHYQQMAHLSSGGSPVQTGEIFATGTISGPTPDSLGCLLESTKGGKEPLALSNGEKRSFLLDGDTVTIHGYAENKDFRVGFGELANLVVPAQQER